MERIPVNFNFLDYKFRKQNRVGLTGWRASSIELVCFNITGAEYSGPERLLWEQHGVGSNFLQCKVRKQIESAWQVAVRAI